MEILGLRNNVPNNNNIQYTCKKVNMIIVEIDLLGARNGFLGRKKFSGHWVYLFLIVVHTVRASFLSVLVPKIFKKLVSVHEIVSKITAF